MKPKFDSVLILIEISTVYQLDVAPMTTQMKEIATVSVSSQQIKDKIVACKQRKDNKPEK